jgi:hypothetical protein
VGLVCDQTRGIGEHAQSRRGEIRLGCGGGEPRGGGVSYAPYQGRQWFAYKQVELGNDFWKDCDRQEDMRVSSCYKSRTDLIKKKDEEVASMRETGLVKKTKTQALLDCLSLTS